METEKYTCYNLKIQRNNKEYFYVLKLQKKK